VSAISKYDEPEVENVARGRSPTATFSTELYAIQQASTKSGQDGVAVVLDRSATTSASDVAAADRRLLHHSSPVCSLT